jgi:two-component system alkaline phosphatase synthesis response regulator PhoP
MRGYSAVRPIEEEWTTKRDAMETGTEKPVILVIDDEEDLLVLTRNLLSKEGYRVVTARDGEEAIWVIRRVQSQGKLALAVVDLMLPIRDGVEVCRFIRRQKEIRNVPILALSAVADSEWRVKALEEGADDFLEKPFSGREFIARVHALVRRVEKVKDEGPFPKARFEMGPIVVDTLRYETWVDGREIRLTPIEFRILVYLVSRKGIAIGRDELMKILWGEDWEVDEHNLNVHIWSLRKKLGENQGGPRFIETLRGTGYRFRDPVALSGKRTS